MHASSGMSLGLIDDQVHPGTFVMRMDNYVIGVSNNVMANRSTLCNSVSVRTTLEGSKHHVVPF